MFEEKKEKIVSVNGVTITWLGWQNTKCPQSWAAQDLTISGTGSIL